MLLELIRISEHNLSEWRSSARIVNDVLDDSLHISISFRIVKLSELSWSLASVGVRVEYGTVSLSLSYSALLGKSVVSDLNAGSIPVKSTANSVICSSRFSTRKQRNASVFSPRGTIKLFDKIEIKI